VFSYLIVFLVTGAAAFLATPIVRRVAVRIGAIDKPSDRKVHPKPTPTLGGLAMWVACLTGLAVAFMLPAFNNLFAVSSEPLGVVLAGTIIVGLGSYDDLRGIAPPAKIAGQVLAGGLLILTGVQLFYFWLPGVGLLSLGQDLAVPLTIIWVVAMINAVNLIDGLDGLAAGVVAIAAVAFFAYTITSQDLIYEGPTPAGLFCVVVAGAALGFLPHNFNPAKIFMGDSGSMLLGLILAAATISGVGRTDSPTNADLAALALPIAIPLLVLAVPFTDVIWAIVRRMRRKRPFYRPDKEHIHHRLLDIGHSHRGAVLLMYLWSALLASLALAITYIKSRAMILSVIFIVAAILVGTAAPRMRRPNGRVRAS
jgi:UDP-GlcNAc:undecaprenyl-phosphate/decaprenyl-phosphate GlcNAc-1-phosphate transferase